MAQRRMFSSGLEGLLWGAVPPAGDTDEVCGHTHREKAKGATFFEATEGETVRPMLDVAWAPMLGAFSVLFEEFPEGEHTTLRTPLPGV